MGSALAQSALGAGHEVTIISGPVSVTYPSGAKLIEVETTDEMLDAAQRVFANCHGAIGAAAPCDYMPRAVSEEKITKTGKPLRVELIETPDVVATLGQHKRDDQWVVGFALETEDRRFRATAKLEQKHCDLMVSNGPQAIDSDHNEVELLDSTGEVIESISGTKQHVADRLIKQITDRLIPRSELLR